VFTALISNALDHAKSTVTIQVSTRNREAVIRVADDGPGFPPDFDTRAFERFSSARGDSREGVSRHYGLGLALVAEIATLHKGRVRTVSGPPGGGAAVVVTLPLA
jgi:signal transduction histidine kinase